MNTSNAKIALNSLLEKFPIAPDVRLLSDEQKAWLHMNIQSIADGVSPSHVIEHLLKIGKRLTYTTEEIPEAELQRIVLFLYENVDEIEKTVSTANYGQTK